MRATILGVVLVLLGVGCGSGSKAPARKYTSVPVAQPMFQVIPANVDPNTARIPGAPGNIVQNAQPDGRSWALDSTRVWQAFPGSGGGGTVSSATAPLSIADGGVMQISAATPDAGGTMSATDKAKLDGINPVGWDTTQWATIKGILGSQVNDYDWMDLLHAYEYDITQGSHPCTQKTGTSMGIMQCPSGGTGTGYVQFASQNTITGNLVAPIANMKTTPWAECNRVKIVSQPTSGQIIWLAFVTAVDASEHEVYLAYWGPHSTSVLELQQDNGGAITVTTANAAGTIGSGVTLGVFNDFCVINDVAGARVVATVNGTIVATSTTLTNMPTTAGAGLFALSGTADLAEPDALLYSVARGN